MPQMQNFGGQNQSMYGSPLTPYGRNFGGQAGMMGMGGMNTMATAMRTGGQNQNQKQGAHEILMVHEVLTHTIDTINNFELYRQHVKDSQLANILDNQLQHMQSGYQNIVNFMHNRGTAHAVPYRAPRSGSPAYGLRNPSPQMPNTSMNQMDDRDVASCMLGCAKSSAIMCTQAALECADPTLRNMMVSCSQSSINQAYEMFQYMNQRGMYQVPTLADNTTQTMVNTYQAPQGGMQMQ
ncbi:spore coat protein [Heliobacterium mobile]|nr:spore coat protein [Heliobacterium mobile]